LKFSDHNTIADNDIRFNGRNGILIIESKECTVMRNYVFSNDRGIMFYDAFDNKVYHNNIVDSWETQAADIGSANIWDDGYPSGGNYWSDYEDIDQYRGSYQNETGSDGIWDHPFGMEGDSHDSYPLVEPWTISSDLNRDGIVNIVDVSIVARAYGTKLGDENWNETADMDKNDEINIMDVSIVALDYGKTV